MEGAVDTTAAAVHFFSLSLLFFWFLFLYFLAFAASVVPKPFPLTLEEPLIATPFVVTPPVAACLSLICEDDGSSHGARGHGRQTQEENRDWIIAIISSSRRQTNPPKICPRFAWGIVRSYVALVILRLDRRMLRLKVRHHNFQARCGRLADDAFEAYVTGSAALAVLLACLAAAFVGQGLLRLCGQFPRCVMLCIGIVRERLCISTFFVRASVGR